MEALDPDSKTLSMLRKAFRAAKRRAVNKNADFSLSIDDVMAVFSNQEGRCFYSKIKMNVVKESVDLHDPYKMTIDCKDPKLGYIKSNIVMCLYCVNSFKQKMSEEEMKMICKNIITNDSKN